VISGNINDFKNNIYILFVLGSFILYSAFNKTGLEVYYIIAVLIYISGFTKYSIQKDLGLSFKLLKDKSFYFYQIPVILTSNLILFLILKNSFQCETHNSNSEPLSLLLLSFIFFNSIRTFGEEFIFRAFLLIKVIQSNNVIFWCLNIVQAFLFSLIHYYIAHELTSKIIFGIYVFILSVYFGWLNRKFNSIIPSWTIHWMNGLQTLIISTIY
jgi:membrane protease YdiL (CAAX protease family)